MKVILRNRQHCGRLSKLSMALPVSKAGRVNNPVLSDMKVLVGRIADLQDSDLRWSFDATFYTNGGVVERYNFDLIYDEAITPDVWRAMITTEILNRASVQSYSITASDIKFGVPNISGSRSESVASRSIVSGTGATGFQPSATRDSLVYYSVSVSTTATIGGSSAGDVALEIAPTNSATAGDWIEKSRTGNSQTITLALVLQSVQVVKGQVSCFVPAGYYVKLRSITGAGSPTYTYISGQEVLL